MAEPVRRIDRTIENHIHAWDSNPAFAPLAGVLRRDRKILLDRLASENTASPDTLRMSIVCFALERVHCGLDAAHFTLFKDAETVQVVLEDAFGIQPGAADDILIPHQEEAIRILVKCLIAKRMRDADGKDILAYMQLFAGTKNLVRPDQDRTMRFKTMIWLIYLAIELVRTEKSACIKGLEYLRSKLRRLLDCVSEGAIINEDSRFPGFEGGRWEGTIFGWLQGEDRKQFVAKLKRQINMVNAQDHANRYLLAEHRKCVFDQVLEMFC